MEDKPSADAYYGGGDDQSDEVDLSFLDETAEK